MNAEKTKRVLIHCMVAFVVGAAVVLLGAKLGEQMHHSQILGEISRHNIQQ